MRRILAVLIVGIALAACDSNIHDSPVTGMQTPTPVYVEPREQLITALQDAGWPESDIQANPADDGPYIVIVTQHIAGKTCTVHMEYFDGDPPTYRVKRIQNMLISELPIELAPQNFNQPGIDRDKLNKQLKRAITKKYLTCSAE